MAFQVGDQGVTESPLYLTGAVRVKGERLMARSAYGPIEAGTPIVVIGDDLNGLVVRPLDAASAETLPDIGREVFTSSSERVQALEAERAEAAERDWASHVKRGTAMSAFIGFVANVPMLLWRWPLLEEQTNTPGLVVISLLLGSAGLGAAMFRFLDAVFGEMEIGYRRLSGLAAGAAVIDSILMAGVTIPLLGLTAGIALAVLAALVSAVAVLLFLMLAGQ